MVTKERRVAVPSELTIRQASRPATPSEGAEVGPSLSTRWKSARLRALVCDDDPQLCDVLDALLRSQGVEVQVVHDVADASAAALTSRPDVMLLALQLAGADGLDVLRNLRSPQSAPFCQVILLSSDAAAHVDAEDFPVVVVERVMKPVRLDHLRRSVLIALARASVARDEARPFILHVDDDPDIRRLVRSLLAPLGEVMAVATLFEARRRLAAIEPDLVVLDIGLADGSGLELLPRLRGLSGSEVPTIVFSGRDHDASRCVDGVKVFAKSCASFEALAIEAQAVLRASGRDRPAKAA